MSPSLVKTKNTVFAPPVRTTRNSLSVGRSCLDFSRKGLLRLYRRYATGNSELLPVSKVRRAVSYAGFRVPKAKLETMLSNHAVAPDEFVWQGYGGMAIGWG